MNETKVKKPFLPRDKPKSWILAVLFGLIALPCGLLAFAGASWHMTYPQYLGTTLFVACWLVAFPNVAYFCIKNFSGRYGRLEDKDWKDQVW